MAEVMDGRRPPVASEPETRDAAETHIANGGDVILFDGVCNLCNASVLFVIDRDPRGHFAFAPLQSPEATQILCARGYTAGPPELASVLLVRGDRVYERSTAALRVSRKLSGAWSFMAAFLIVPRPVRDAVYDWIARNRYRWFGHEDACRIPTPELRSRFVGGLSAAGQ